MILSEAASCGLEEHGMPRFILGALAVLIGAFALPPVAVCQTGITDYLVTTTECAEWDTG